MPEHHPPPPPQYIIEESDDEVVGRQDTDMNITDECEHSFYHFLRILQNNTLQLRFWQKNKIIIWLKSFLHFWKIEKSTCLSFNFLSFCNCPYLLQMTKDQSIFKTTYWNNTDHHNNIQICKSNYLQFNFDKNVLSAVLGFNPQHPSRQNSSLLTQIRVRCANAFPHS